jgi:hypothetical protein
MVKAIVAVAYDTSPLTAAQSIAPFGRSVTPAFVEDGRPDPPASSPSWFVPCADYVGFVTSEDLLGALLSPIPRDQPSRRCQRCHHASASR